MNCRENWKSASIPGNILNIVLIHCDLISDITEEQHALHTDNNKITSMRDLNSF